MAINGLVFAGKEFHLSIAEETTFGTEVTTGFQRLFTTDVSDFDFGGIIKDDTPRNAGKRVRDVSDIFIQKAGGEYRVAFDCVLTDITVDLLLYAILQNVTEAVGTPYKKDFVWDETTTQPDFSANAGKFFTVLLHNPITSESFRLTSAILESLTINYNLGSAGGRAMASGVFYSGFAPGLGVDSSAYSFTSPGTNYFKTQDISKKQINGIDMVLDGYSFSYQNSAKRVGSTSNGDAETYALTNYDMEGSSITVKYDANSKTFIDDFVAGTTRTIQIDYGTSGSLGAFGQIIRNAEFEGFEKDMSNELGAMVNIPFKMAQTGTTNALDIEVSNDTDRSW